MYINTNTYETTKDILIINFVKQIIHYDNKCLNK